METFDVVVLGAGPGGYPAAIRAAQLGASVALVEKEQLGGTCLNRGCIPSKTLIAAADTLVRIKRAATFGITVSGVAVDYAALIGRKDKVVGTLRAGIQQLLAGNGVKVLPGAASLVDRAAVEIAGPTGTTRIGGRKIIIATGSTSTMPGSLPKHDRIIESRGFLELTRLPASLIVLGGGYIGCELACMAASLGVKVTLVELLEDILVQLDADVRREVRLSMEKTLGIRVCTGRPLEEITADGGSVSGRVGEETITAELLLCAVGRRPVTEGLRLESAGLQTDERGFIEADEYCRTKVPTVFAVGDVTGKVPLAHYATAQGVAAAENAVGQKPRRHDTLVPNVLFTAPEVGTVGLGEDEARKQNRSVKTGKFRFAASGRALAAGETAGFAKWIADAATDQLLGAAVVGAHATELIAEATAAIRAELTSREIGRTIHGHPTLGEVWMEAAHTLHGEGIHTPPRPKR